MNASSTATSNTSLSTSSSNHNDSSCCDNTTSLEWQNLASLKGLNPDVRSLKGGLSDDGRVTELSIDWCSYDEKDEDIKHSTVQKYMIKLETLWSLQSITTLQLSNYPFQTLPEGLGRLTTLKHLEITRCRELIELPSSIGQLRNLEALKVCQCYKLKSLPESIGNLKQLETFESDGNHNLQYVPPTLGRLVNLKVLKISHASEQLKLPTEIGRLQRLEVLILSILSGVQTLPIDYVDNDDTDDQEEHLLPSLQHLQMFGCSKDTLRVDNMEKMDLQNIKSIRLSKIDTLPLALKEKTPSLETLHLTGVPHDALINFFSEPWPEDNTAKLDTLVFTGIKSGEDFTLRDDYSKILPGLPTSLSRLDLANQGIDTLDGFLDDSSTKTLPNGLQTLFLDGNPILKSTNSKEQANLHALLKANPHLGCIGWDRHLHHLHPEYAPSKFFDPRYQLFTPSTTLLLLLNRCGRALLCDGGDDDRCHSTTSNSKSKENDQQEFQTVSTTKNNVPLGLWPLVLSKVPEKVWNNDGNGNSSVVADRSMEYSVIYELLQGSALMERPRGM